MISRARRAYLCSSPERSRGAAKQGILVTGRLAWRGDKRASLTRPAAHFLSKSIAKGSGRFADSIPPRTALPHGQGGRGEGDARSQALHS